MSHKPYPSDVSDEKWSFVAPCEQERDQVDALCQAAQQATGSNVRKALADQGCTGQKAQDAAAQNGIALDLVKLREAKKGQGAG